MDCNPSTPDFLFYPLELGLAFFFITSPLNSFTPIGLLPYYIDYFPISILAPSADMS